MSSGTQPPTIVYLIGAPAGGKMTIAQELCRLIGFPLFHGHVVAGELAPYFPFGTLPFVRLGQS